MASILSRPQCGNPTLPKAPFNGSLANPAYIFLVKVLLGLTVQFLAVSFLVPYDDT